MSMSETIDCSAFVKHVAPGRASMDIAVEGIRCAACATAIERGLAKEPGVANARVNFALKRVTVEFDEAKTAGARILEKLDAIGYQGHPFEAGAADKNEAQATAHLLRCLGVAAFGAMNIMLLSVSVWSGNVSDIDSETRDFFHWLSALIALPVAAYSGRPFFDSALAALRRGAVNMDVPITLGIVLALMMSVAQTMQHAEHAYFDSAVMLIFFLLIGRLLDQMMRKRTRDLAANLASLRAETALKLEEDGSTVLVPVRAIMPGDRILVRPGDKIGVDGIVRAGRSHVDQSLVTGETAHVPLSDGDRVYAGTSNVDGALTVEVTASNEGTLLDEIEKLLGHATAVRSTYVLLADRAARLYAPFVHTMAAATFVGWMLAGLPWSQSLVIAITVLIITCPCALGLAIPAVQVIASGSLFRSGVLLRTGDVIERLAEADTVIFDKTGTLTLPSPEVVNAAEIDADIYSDAARLALSSRHPLAQALARSANADTPFYNVREEAGQGISCTVDGRELRLGSASFCGAEAEAAAVAQAHPGASFVCFSDGVRKAAFALGQQLRADAVETVTAMRARGLDVEILSGDSEAAVEDIARQLGVIRWQAGVKPAGKIARLDALRAQGRKTLMIGDGLNDAPALAAAHVSMSPVTAAHLSQTAADALFLGEKLSPVLQAIDVARRGRRLMMQNIWFAVGYNIIAVPLAVAGLATPLVAALAMSGSSVVVTVNALRARGEGART
jgi:Cu2+-exporting ATPase